MAESKPEAGDVVVTLRTMIGAAGTESSLERTHEEISFRYAGCWPYRHPIPRGRSFELGRPHGAGGTANVWGALLCRLSLREVPSS